MRKKTLIVALISAALLIGASGCANIGLGILGALISQSPEGSKAEEELSKAEEEASGAMKEASRAAEEAMSVAREEASRAAAEASRAAQQALENKESYRRLKEEWDEASRRQQSRVDEIMGRNRGSSAASSENNSGNTASKPAVAVSGTWYGPKNQHTGDQSIVTLNSNGTGRVTIDLGASETATFNATYTSMKAGPYEYDDIVCRVTLSGGSISGYGFPSNTFTFKIDPEVENGMYAYFVDSGFGMIPAGATFTK